MQQKCGQRIVITGQRKSRLEVRRESCPAGDSNRFDQSVKEAIVLASREQLRGHSSNEKSALGFGQLKSLAKQFRLAAIYEQSQLFGVERGGNVIPLARFQHLI